MAWKRTRSNASSSAGQFENSLLEEDRHHTQLLRHGNSLKSTLAEIFSVQAAQTKKLVILKKENQRLLKSDAELKEKVLKLEKEILEKGRFKDCKKEPGVENNNEIGKIWEMADKLADARHELNRRDEVLVALKRELREKDEELKMKLKEKHDVLLALKTELKEKDEGLLDLRRTLKERNAERVALKKELKEKVENLLALKKELKGKDPLSQCPLKKEAKADAEKNDSHADDDDDDDADDDDDDDDVQEVTKEGIPVQEVKAEFTKPSTEIDHAAFKEALKRMLVEKSKAGTWKLLNLNDPQWHPFRTVFIEGSNGHEEILDYDNGRIANLRSQIGEELADRILFSALREGVNSHRQHLKRRREN